MSELLSDLRDALKEEYQHNRKGVHISDLTLCPRESIFRRIRSHELDDKTLMFFSLGQGHHALLQSLLKWFGKKSVKIEKEIKYNGVVGHIDAIVNGIPIEFKTHRSKTHQLRDHYLIQLKSYMAMLGSKAGKIISVGLIQFDEPFKEFDITMTDEEIKEQLEWIDREAKQYNEALEKKDWKLARAVKDTPLEWKCEHCAFKNECWEFENKK